MTERVRQLFLSSTAKDLAAHREVVLEAIRDLSGWQAIAMENFGARDAAADDFCRAEVERCDLFIGLIGHCYGGTPTNDPDGVSFTEREYDTAETAGKGRLMFLAREDFPLRGQSHQGRRPSTKAASFS